jgi:hypothetical protein
MDEYCWTNHAQWKMKYYGLSKQKVSGIIRRPDRIEKGIAGNGTVAVMQAVSPKMIDGRKVWKHEVWTMYQQQKTSNKEQKRILRQGFIGHVKIISAWRYPGVSPKNNPIPEAIFQEILDREANE